MAELADTLCSGCVTIGFYFDWSGFSLLISTLQGFLGKFQPSKKSGILIRGCVGTGRRAGFGSRHDSEYILSPFMGLFVFTEFMYEENIDYSRRRTS